MSMGKLIDIVVNIPDVVFLTVVVVGVSAEASEVVMTVTVAVSVDEISGTCEVCDVIQVSASCTVSVAVSASETADVADACGRSSTSSDIFMIITLKTDTASIKIAKAIIVRFRFTIIASMESVIILALKLLKL